MSRRRFATVDVFSEEPMFGNPVAVVVDGDGLSEDTMQRFAAWTNLSETTFLLPPTTPDAAYRVRIFTPTDELPFAGHPTLGSAAAFAAAGGRRRETDRLVQESAAGLVTVYDRGGSWEFVAPPLSEGPCAVSDGELEAITAQLGIDAARVLSSRWLDNGPRWATLLLDDPGELAAIQPAGGHLFVGVAAWHPTRGAGPDGADLSVRAFFSVGSDVREDPVTGSLNAGLAQWFLGVDPPPCPFDIGNGYIAEQGRALGRRGRVTLRRSGSEILVGGRCHHLVSGTVDL